MLGGDPRKFQMPSESEMRFNWVHGDHAALEPSQAREFVVDAWRMVVAQRISARASSPIRMARAEERAGDTTLSSSHRTGRYPRTMRRIVIVPLLLAAGLLAGCSQVAQVAGDAMGVDVEAACTTIDDAYAQYQTLLDQGGASAEQIDAARDELVTTLDTLATDVDGQLGDLISSGAQQIGGMTDLQAPETIEAIDQLKASASAFCG